jgi:ubiquinone/menaquinone biosynthesis C-methylase UbiE
VKLDDSKHVGQQYSDSSNLDARVRMHESFDVSRERWPHWLFARLGLAEGERVLEIGCGTGNVWRDNAERIPEGVSLTLTDLSPGMLEEARARLDALDSHLEFRQADAQSLPFADSSFDAALSSHMLYHVPDRGKALGELARVLRPGGRLMVTTYPWTHLLELRELVERLGLAGKMLPARRESHEFDLERAVDEIAAVLPVERVERRDSALRVTDVEVLVAYVRSLAADVDPAALERVRAHVARQIELVGAFQIQISAGLVTARKR